MGRFGQGQGPRRVEDRRFLTGAGRYTDDIVLDGQAWGVVVRSAHAHGLIASIDTDDALTMPGVLGVFTAADIEAAGLGGLPTQVKVKNRDGTTMMPPHRPVLARERVRFVGEPVAFVVAETLNQARDAAEAVLVDIDPLDPVADIESALAAGAPDLHAGECPGNILFDWETGDPEGTSAAFAEAAHVVSLDLINSRVAPTPMEPRGAIGRFDADAERYELFTGSQGSHTLRGWLARHVLKIPEDRLRVVSPDVGGGFGMRLFLMNEHALVLFAARALGRPVKWIAERAEGFASDLHGRDHLTRAELALDADGRFLAVRVDVRANIGAYCSQMGAFIPTMAGAAMIVGVYRFRAATMRSRGVMTSTTPTDAYRGAGRPEAAYMLDRLIDVAARRLAVAPDELRRRNLIPPEALPFKTVMGRTIDSGDFRAMLDRALARADWAGAEGRKANARAAGRMRGIGLSYYVEACGGGNDETATLRVAEDGAVTVLIGTQSTGQGHETAYAQMVADALGVPMQSIRVRQGDTDEIATGRGTGGSRSIPVGGASLAAASADLIEHARAVAAHVLEADGPDDIVHDPETGLFRRPGTNRVLHLAEIAQATRDPANRPEGADGPGLSASHAWTPPEATYPNGCHVCEVDIDPATGHVTLDRYTIVDDVGVVLNPLLLEGQIIGGAAQGIAQALMEQIVYDRDSGQLLTGTFQDYQVPRARDLPDFVFEAVQDHPCRTNPLGVKGAGEAGTVGAAPAVINAVVDALAPLGLSHIDMPASPPRIWRAIQSAGRESLA